MYDDIVDLVNIEVTLLEVK